MVIYRMKVAAHPAHCLTSPRSSAFSVYPEPRRASLRSPRYRQPAPSLLDLTLLTTGHSPLTPLDSTLTKSVLARPDSRAIKPLESIANLLSPLELTLTRSVRSCPNLQQITPLKSIFNLLSPLERTLTKNAPVSPLESTLTKLRDLKSHRIILLQKRWGRGGVDLDSHR
jgi:hypothetical protein